MKNFDAKTDLKTRAIVLRRTNFGEADRILNLITPEGKISALARGVRKEKSKLAGGVEMFSLIEIVVHMGRGELGTVTSAKMVRYYGGLVTDLKKMELAAEILKKVNRAAEGATGGADATNADAARFFEITDAALFALNDGADAALVESWFLLNLLTASGEEVNLYRDAVGEKLEAGVEYSFDAMEGAFFKHVGGEFGTAEIKMLRLMLSADLTLARRVKNADAMLPKLLRFAQVASKMV